MMTGYALMSVLPQGAEFDPSSVTPGVVGFLLTGFVGVSTVFLIVDMVRRIRRVTFRAEHSAIAKGATEER